MNQDTNIVYCSELIEKLMESSPCIIPPGESDENPKEADGTESREGMLTKLSTAITKELYLIVEWAKLVPGFENLCRKDQIALLTAGGMELIVFRVIYRSIPYKEYVYMNSTTLLEREDCYSVLNKEIVDMILDVVERLRPLAMDQVEFACLKTILLANPGRDFQCITLHYQPWSVCLVDKCLSIFSIAYLTIFLHSYIHLSVRNITSVRLSMYLHKGGKFLKKL